MDYDAKRIKITAEAVQALSVDKLGTDTFVGFHVTGPCPRCADVTYSDFPVKFITGSTTPSPGNGAASATVIAASVRYSGGTIRRNEPSQTYVDERIALVHCECTVEHPKAEGQAGCGASWLLKATFNTREPDGRISLGTVTEEEETKYLQGAIAQSQAIPNSLSRVQNAASKWQTTLTTALGIIGLAGVLGRDTIQSLNGCVQIIVLIAAGVAIVMNALALYKVTLASVGSSKVKNAGVLQDLADADFEPLKQAIKASDNLSCGLLFAAISLAAAVVAVGFAWKAPAAQSSGTVSITLDSSPNTSQCGMLSKTKSNDMVVFTPSDTPKTQQTYSISQIATITGC